MFYTNKEGAVMATRKKQDSAHISILDAVEALETIADLEFEREVELASEDEINEQNHQVTLRTVKWLGKEDHDETAELIKDSFHVVLGYLRNFYKHEYGRNTKPKVIEGVKTIMVLVGEAAQKLDKYTTIFKHTKSKNVKALKEYKELQEFYLTRIARKVDEGVLGKWILGLTKGALAKREAEAKLKGKRPISSRYVFIDLEAVKRDTEYELFFLRKEDGSRFFNPRLIRNIKLTCDFGETIKREKAKDPLEDVKVWHDHSIHIVAKEIVRSTGNVIDRYFQEIKDSPKRELVSELNKAIIALFMCCNPKNLLRNAPVKQCSEYFIDFQFFLRKALNSREYQRYVVYPPKKSERLAQFLLELVYRFCGALFTAVRGYKELLPVFEKVFQEAAEMQSSEHEKAANESKMLWNSLSSDFVGLKKLIKQHPNGPLEKVLEIIELGAYHSFDPILQGNIPYQLYSLYLNEKKMANIRIPAPTEQQFIHKAKTVEEFKGFLRFYSKGQLKRTHLLINLQDRTSWKDHARCVALEDTQGVRQFSKSLSVVTLSKDTEFYHQAPPYHQDNHAEVFMDHFREHLSDENCGFFFPQTMKKKLFPKFIDGLMRAIHKTFFGEMNVLTVNNRRDFIEIFYLFLQLKILEMLKPDSFSFTCKDGIDSGGAASAQLYAFLKVLTDKDFADNDAEHINFILYIAPLLLRERSILPDVFDRMIHAIRRVESTKEDLGVKEFNNIVVQEFGKLYKTSILKSLTLVPEL